MFFINKIEYEFDEERKTSKQVYEIEQSKEQEEVLQLSELLGDTLDGKTFEDCKFFIDPGTSPLVSNGSKLISDDARFYKIQNTLVNKAQQIQQVAEEETVTSPSTSPSALGIVGYQVRTPPPPALFYFGLCRSCKAHFFYFILHIVYCY